MTALRAWLATPPSPGGIAVVVLDGESAAAVLGRIVRRRDGGPLTDRAPIAGGWLWLDGRRLDRVLVCAADGHFELHLHGSPALVRRLAEWLEHAGHRVAPEGWLSPLPLGAGEDAAVAARGEGQLRLALEQRQWSWPVERARIAALEPGRRRSATRALARRSAIARALLTPCPLVLCGRQNAGKSSLLNALVGRPRALVGPLPGLTRDPVGEVVLLDGYPYEVVDTAGEPGAAAGSPADAIDRVALRRGRQRRRGAWRVLVIDGAAGPSALDGDLRTARTCVVRNKTDLPQAAWPWPPADLEACCIDPAAHAALRGRLGAWLRHRRRLPAAGPVGGAAALDDAQRADLRALRASLYGGGAPE